MGLRLDARHRAVSLLLRLQSTGPVELSVPGDDRDGGAQLVRGIRHETTETLLALDTRGESLLDPSQHHVDRRSEATHLGSRIGVVDALREITRCDRPGRLDHVIDRAHAGADRPPSCCDEHGEKSDTGHEPDEGETSDGGIDFGQGSGRDDRSPVRQPAREDPVDRAGIP